MIKHNCCNSNDFEWFEIDVKNKGDSIICNKCLRVFSITLILVVAMYDLPPLALLGLLVTWFPDMFFIGLLGEIGK